MCEICSRLIIKTTERRHRRYFRVFIGNFEQVSHIIYDFFLGHFLRLYDHTLMINHGSFKSFPNIK